MKKLPDHIMISWHYEDVKEVRPDLSRKKCREVLQRLKDCHNAEYGINWDTIKAVADDMYPLP